MTVSAHTLPPGVWTLIDQGLATDVAIQNNSSWCSVAFTFASAMPGVTSQDFFTLVPNEKLTPSGIAPGDKLYARPLSADLTASASLTLWK
jgi:hypothetical protein